MKEVISKEIAEADVSGWLDYKRIPFDVREANKTIVETLVRAVQYGDIVIDVATFEIKHKLSFPPAGLFSEITYKPRLTVGELQKATSAVKDIDSKIAGYVAAIAGQSVSHIQKMDVDDFKVSQAVAVFFM